MSYGSKGQSLDKLEQKTSALSQTPVHKAW